MHGLMHASHLTLDLFAIYRSFSTRDHGWCHVTPIVWYHICLYDVVGDGQAARRLAFPFGLVEYYRDHITDALLRLVFEAFSVRMHNTNAVQAACS